MDYSHDNSLWTNHVEQLKLKSSCCNFQYVINDSYIAFS